MNTWRAALAEVASRAWLGGVTALQASGLTGLDDATIHVWVSKSTQEGRPMIAGNIVLHESRRWTDADVLEVGIPRARSAVAAVQAALWSGPCGRLR